MLTAELVRVRKRDGVLSLCPLDPRRRKQAEALAGELLAVARAAVGKTRDELLLALRAEAATCHVHRKLANGLVKVLEDRCEFSAEPADVAAARREEVFLAAARARREGRFERDAVLREVAKRFGLTSHELDERLYADLKGAGRLLSVPGIAGQGLVASYEEAQEQAVLMRAVRLRARVRCSTAAGYRYIFQRLKFRRLLFEAEALAEGGYAIRITGPYSLFEATTSYGLALALVLPALKTADSLELEADVLWGVEREPLVFHVSSERTAPVAFEPALLPELTELVSAFARQSTAWTLDMEPTLLQLPGVGLCVPDLCFVHQPGGERVFFELLGYWSREAVFKRLELARAGLGIKLLLAVNKKLRIAEDLGDVSAGAGIYVFTHTLSPAAILAKLEAMRIAQSGSLERPG